MKRFVVVVTDYGDSCDGHARFLGAFDTEAEARGFVREDMKDLIRAGGSFGVVDETKLELWDCEKCPRNGSVYTVLDTSKEDAA